MPEDTIVALATSPGKSAIAVIRVSGPQCLDVLAQVTTAGIDTKLVPRQAVLVDLFSSASQSVSATEAFIDRCIIVFYPSPNSYTGEDVAEIFCHGGELVPRLILSALLATGARSARPGEFTQRAFLNGKLDLAQAEAIEHIVSARTISELSLAHQQYSGQFSRDMERLRADLIDLLSLLELELDFSDEDVEFANRTELLNRVQALLELLEKLVSSYNRAHLLREGIRVAIVGRPNVGKSSLLNLLLKRERAIVTEIPGTTRDIIEEGIDIGGKKFVIVDTAGIRDSDNVVEMEGIRRSESALHTAPVVVLLIDQSSRLQKEDWEVRQRVLQAEKAINNNRMLVVNKIDLDAKVNQTELEAFARGFATIRMSCWTGEGIGAFERQSVLFAEQMLGSDDNSIAALITLRQKDAAQKALVAVRSAGENLRGGLSQEFVAADLRLALDALAEIVGEVTTEDILGNIFSRFCIGK